MFYLTGTQPNAQRPNLVFSKKKFPTFMSFFLERTPQNLYAEYNENCSKVYPVTQVTLASAYIKKQEEKTMKFRKIRLGQLGSHETVAFAVDELQKYLKRIDPELFIEILLLDKPNDACGNVVWVGLHDSFKVPVVEDRLLDDAVAISVENGAGYISGANERSVLIAAYRFLKELGCDWFRPGTDGFRVKQKELDNITVHVEEVPSCRHRGVCIEGAISTEHVVNMLDYLPRVGMNEYYIQFLTPAIFFERWWEHQNNPYAEESENLSPELLTGLTLKMEQEIKKRSLRYRKVGHGWGPKSFGMDATGWHGNWEHHIPEETKPVLAMLNGKRDLHRNSPLNTQLCYSQPIVRSRIVDTFVEYCKENPHVHHVEFCVSDGIHNWCECDACRKLRPSDWVLKILNELDERLIAEKLPNRVTVPIYHELMWEPLEEKPRNPDRIGVLFCPITRTHDRSFADCQTEQGKIEAFAYNKAKASDKIADNMAYLHKWTETLKGEVVLFDYHLMWTHINDPGYERIAKVAHDDMKFLPAMGIQGMISCQTQRCAFPTNLPLHMIARGLWDSNSAFETEADAYYLSAYGPDGLQVRQYLAAVSNAMHLIDYPDFELPQEALCEDYEGLYRLIREFRPVIDHHAAAGDEYAGEWKLLQHHSDYLQRYVRMYELIEQGKTEEGKDEANKLFLQLAANEQETQSVLDVWNHIKVFREKLQIHTNLTAIADGINR